MLARFPKAVLIVGSLMGSAALFALTVLTVSSLQDYGNDIGEVLPASPTLAIVHHASEKLLPLWKTTTLKPGATVALLGSGALKGVVTVERKNPEKTYAFEIAPYGLTFSDPSLRKFFGKSQTPLADFAPYKALRAAIEREEGWIFWKKEFLPRSGFLLDRILSRAFSSHPDAAAVTVEARQWIVAAYEAESDRDPQAASLKVPAFSGAILTLITTDLRPLFETLRTGDASEGLMLESSLRQKVASTFGPGVSVEYDLLPLFAKTGTVQLAASGAQVTYLLSGTLPKNGTTILRHLHTSMKELLPTSRFESRVLDGRFPQGSLRDDPDVLRNSKEERSGWSIEKTVLQGSTVGLLTARKGNRFLISNTESVLSTAISASDRTIGLPKERMGFTVTGGGIVHMKQMRELLAGSLPSFTETLLPFTGSEVRWIVERSRDTAVLVLEEHEEMARK